MFRTTSSDINDFMQIKGRQATDESSIGTYVVCGPFHGAFFGLNSNSPIDSGPGMLASFFFHNCLSKHEDVFLENSFSYFLEGLEPNSNYRNEGQRCNKKNPLTGSDKQPIGAT
jgi:hypothetical protein